MGRALPNWTRRRIVEEHRAGKTLTEIAHQHQLSYSTVCRCWQRYKRQGLEGLTPDYQNCGRAGPDERELPYRAARYLKRLHPGWGAALIRTKLQLRYPDLALPSVRTLQRWFKRAGLSRLRKELPKQERPWAKTVHEVWQVDAKERLSLEEGERACYLTMVDEHSGALLEAPVFPPQPDQPG